MLRIEKIQRKVTKFICFKFKCYGLKYRERLKILNIQSLYSRKCIQILKLLFKMYHKKQYFSRDMLQYVSFYKHLWHGLLIEVPKLRIELCNKFFFYNAFKLFNNFSYEIRNENVFAKYIKLLNNVFNAKPCIEDWD